MILQKDYLAEVACQVHPWERCLLVGCPGELDATLNCTFPFIRQQYLSVVLPMVSPCRTYETPAVTIEKEKEGAYDSLTWEKQMSKAQEELSAFPRQLRAEREQRGWSQARVAELLVTDIKTVSRWERGIVTPAPYLREKLCELFGKTPQAFGLFDHEHEETSPSPGFLRDPLLPMPPAYPLIGRERELTMLRQRLRLGGNLAVSALNGLPGVGKIAISLVLAHDPELQAHFKDGILWAGLGPDPDILGHIHRWASLLDLSPDELVDFTDLDAWLFALRRAVGSRTMLLIIDDVWKTEDALTFQRVRM